jgi:hypothetical protein
MSTHPAVGREHLTHVSARVSGQERACLDKIAASTDRTPSAVVRLAFRIYINHFSEADRLLENDVEQGNEVR